jgi:hypothetical protein
MQPSNPEQSAIFMSTRAAAKKNINQSEEWLSSAWSGDPKNSGNYSGLEVTLIPAMEEKFGFEKRKTLFHNYLDFLNKKERCLMTSDPTRAMMKLIESELL